jgi:hypothetical protein
MMSSVLTGKKQQASHKMEAKFVWGMVAKQTHCIMNEDENSELNLCEMWINWI